ncbi:MAG TPA: TetR/AcrR family transcriptional regulator [Ktedonobacterales bacterium]|nr:TetR/AcrR family transcriptional regulator [Ktedonobacterales bacterium]
MAAQNTLSENGAKRGKAVLAPVTARGEATRRRILDAAEAVFGEQGYYEASVSEITRRAGVAQGTFYLYFPGKRDIFVELVEDLGKRLRVATSMAIAGATDRLEIERLGYEAFFHFVAAHRRVYSIVQEAERVAPEAAQSYYHHIADGYQRGLEQAMRDGSINILDAEATAYALMGIAHFAALRWLIWPQHESESPEIPSIPPQIFASIMEFIAHGFNPLSSTDHA